MVRGKIDIDYVVSLILGVRLLVLGLYIYCVIVILISGI